MAWTTATPSQLFFTKNDPKDPRLGEWTTSHPLRGLHDVKSTQSSWMILGYPDDDGIALNGGRVGAKEAPNFIRTYFYKMTPSLLKPQRQNLMDLGNISLELPLADRHERARLIVKTALTAGHRTIGLGGGHDYGYADGAGFLDAYLAQGERPVIINFDAHLDVRPTDKGFSSGTPFYRLLTQYENKFDFVEVGLQNQCNSADHLNWARSKNAHLLLMQDIREIGLKKSLEAVLEPWKGRPCFLSVDIDAFTSAEAPGCSQSWATGFSIQDFLPALDYVKAQLDVRSLAVYEVSPPLDIHGQTSKLAALILHHCIF
ncbi:MAG: formimidoylglutamase [Bdellovibrionaceae bacterium]|nr:formimidoylglutamase [Pseudobdellovibrionaceae bacterium]